MSEPMPSQLEARLLSALRPGEILRFVLAFEDDGRVAVSLEGAGARSSSMMERIEALLHASREEGYVFAGEKPTSTKTATAASRWCGGTIVDVVPTGHLLKPLPRVSVGFAGGDGPKDVANEYQLSVPAFPAHRSDALAGHPMKFLIGSGSVARLEFEFTRIELPDRTAAAVAQALEEDLALGLKIHGAQMPATPRTTFLGLWWSRRAGWKVACRAAIRKDSGIPLGLLEVLGRAFFGVECSVRVQGGDTARGRKADDLSLVDGYPEGWAFPPILPSIGDSGNLVADRIHNLRLPALPAEGVVAGSAEGKPVRLPTESRDRHTYIVGATGTGKSTLLLRLIKEDLKRDEGLLLIDPHGDLYQKVLKAIPRSRRDKLVTIDPTSHEKVVGFNIFDFPRDEFVKRRTEALIGEMVRFFRETWADNPEAFGPIFEQYFRNCLLLMVHQRAYLPTLLDAERVFTEKEFRAKLIEGCTEPRVVTFWKEVAEKTSGEISLTNVTPYITSKVSALTQSGFLSEMLGRVIDQLQLEKRISEGGIILVNLNKGLLGANESRLLGVLLTMQIFAAGLKRSLMPEKERKPVNVYIDEFQNFVSDNVASMLSEARKFGLRLTLANQTLAQLRANRGRQDLLETVLGNVGNIVLFRLGVHDAERLRPFLKPFAPEQMQDLPNFHALVRLLDGHGPIGPFVMKTLPQNSTRSGSM